MSKLVLSVKEDMGVPQQCDEAVLKECIRGWSSSGILIQINTHSDRHIIPATLFIICLIALFQSFKQVFPYVPSLSARRSRFAQHCAGTSFDLEAPLASCPAVVKQRRMRWQHCFQSFGVVRLLDRHRLCYW
jgi:hypothetical protein